MDLDDEETERDVDRYADDKRVLILEQAHIPDASLQSLKHSFSELTGQSPDPLWSVTVLRHKVSMAILSGIDARGHMGVKQGQKIIAATHSEVINWAPMVMQIMKATEHQRELAAPKPQKPERGAATPREPRGSNRFEVMQSSASMQPGSTRTKVYNALKEMGSATIPELDDKVGFSTRAIMHALRKLKHVKEIL
jgi:hypothetical protein